MSRPLYWLLSRSPRTLRRLAGPPIDVDGQTLDADAQLILRVMKHLPGVGLDGSLTAPVARARFERLPNSHGGRWRVPTTDLAIGLEGRSLPTRWYEPCAPDPAVGVLVYYHGGGWTIGSINSYDTVCHQLARFSGCPVVSVEYRLAPEHPFPAAFDDAVDVLDPIAAAAHGRGWSGDRLAVGGDSAGGNLAAAACIARRETGAPLAGQLLVYPGVDATSRRPSYTHFATSFGLESEGVLWFKRNYLPDRSDYRRWEASPLRAASHADLPPAVVVVAGFDPLRDDAVAYADALEAAGVSVERHLYPGQFHGFFHIGDISPTGRAAVERAAAHVAGWLRDDP